jgi:hypothetical protein
MILNFLLFFQNLYKNNNYCEKQLFFIQPCKKLMIDSKVVNSVSVSVSFFQLEWNVLVLKCFGVPFRGCTVYIYIYIYIYNKHNSNSR